jgi:hypothetical protein
MKVATPAIKIEITDKIQIRTLLRFIILNGYSSKATVKLGGTKNNAETAIVSLIHFSKLL